MISTVEVQNIFKQFKSNCTGSLPFSGPTYFENALAWRHEVSQHLPGGIVLRFHDAAIA